MDPYGSNPENLPAVPPFSDNSHSSPSDSGDETARLLRELLETQKRSLRTARLALALCLVLLTAAALTVPAAVWTARRVTASMEQVSHMARTVETAAEQAGRTASRLGELGDALAEGDGLSDALSRLPDALSGLSGLSDALSGLTGDGKTLADSVRSFQEGVESFRSVMEKLNGIDFDALNQSIQDLSGMAAPFRQFSGLFGG